MAQVIRLEAFGHAYRNGRRYSGFGRIYLDDGKPIYVSEEDAFFDGMLKIAAAAGHDVARMTARLDIWVKTGQMPPHEEPTSALE